MHQQRLPGDPEVGPQAVVVAVRAEQVQIHAQRHHFDIRCADPPELGSREFGGAHHHVVFGGGVPVGDIGAVPGDPGRHDLPQQPVEALMGDHHPGHVPAPRPAAETAQRQPIGHLQYIGSQAVEDIGDPPRVGRPVATRPRDPDRGQGDAQRAARQDLFGASRPGHDEHDLVAGGHVAGTEMVQRGTQAPRARAVEIRQLHDAHVADRGGSRVTTGTGALNSR